MVWVRPNSFLDPSRVHMGAVFNIIRSEKKKDLETAILSVTSSPYRLSLVGSIKV